MLFVLKVEVVVEGEEKESGRGGFEGRSTDEHGPLTFSLVAAAAIKRRARASWQEQDRPKHMLGHGQYMYSEGYVAHAFVTLREDRQHKQSIFTTIHSCAET